MDKKILLFFNLLSFFFIPLLIRAFCPVCTVAVGVGVGLSRYLGIDDLISGTWIGGLVMSLVLWAINWLDKRKIRFLFRKILVLIFFYSAVVFPLLWFGIIGDPYNKFLGIDKLLFGIIVGGFAFLMSFIFHNFLKNKNQGKSFFSFQKIVFPVIFLLITSFILFLIR